MVATTFYLLLWLQLIIECVWKYQYRLPGFLLEGDKKDKEEREGEVWLLIVNKEFCNSLPKLLLMDWIQFFLKAENNDECILSFIPEKYNIKQTTPLKDTWNSTNYAISHFLLLSLQGNIHQSIASWSLIYLDKGFLGTSWIE